MVENFISRPLQWDLASPSMLSSMLRSVYKIDEPHGYTTSSLFSGEKLHRLLNIPNNIFSNIRVELLPEGLQEKWEMMGIKFTHKDNLNINYLSELLNGSYELLSVSKNLTETISNFVYILHVISSSELNVDISLSDPNIPFSIFISLPNEKEHNQIERFCEGLIHEALHLQLSALEMFIELVDNKKMSSTVYSPWKGERRNDRGLLHAVYVFSSLYKFWGCISNKVVSSASFASKRQEEIFLQMNDAKHLLSSQALTTHGHELAQLHINEVVDI